MVFDDLYPHQVHNDTDGVRAVLFVDFERPCRAPVRWLNRLVLMAAPFTDEIRRGKVNHDAWERGYYGKKQGAAECPGAGPQEPGSWAGPRRRRRG